MAINAEGFRDALDQIEIARGISKEVIIDALKEAMVKGYRKELGGDDALVEVNIDVDNGIIEMFQMKNIVENIVDDFLEVDEAEAKDICKKDGVSFIKDNRLYTPCPIDELRKATAMSIKSILRQKFAEAEKDVLYEAFKDKINTMITGRIEKIDERGASVNIGRTSVYLPRKQMIGDERFSAGDQIRLFVSDVVSDAKGAHIVVSRANEGFLHCLFNEEIREIYDGTIIIKGIAREAGERSKVAVYSQNPDVDPAGACIGQNGSRIQKIVSQLGNGTSKEKIDIIAYSDNIGLYIMESLKPAHVAGVIFDEEKKTATAIVKDDSLSLAIGRRGVNVRLAVRLTGYNIDIKTETDALENGLEYHSYEELQASEIERKKQLLAEMKAKQAEVPPTSGDILPGLPEGYVAPQARVYEDERNDFDATFEEENDEEVTPVAPVSPSVVEEKPVVSVEKSAEVSQPEAVAAPQEEEVEEVKVVKTTTTLSALEESLSKEEKKGPAKKNWRKFPRKDDDKGGSDASDDEGGTPIVGGDNGPRMSIYTEEELKAMEEEDKKSKDETPEATGEDVDYDEYDEYYDDDDK